MVKEKYVVIAVMFLSAVVNTGCSHKVKDYVSDYDFSRASLAELPWEVLDCMCGTRLTSSYAFYVEENLSDWNAVQFILGEPEFNSKSYESSCSNEWHVYTVDDSNILKVKYDKRDPDFRLVDGRYVGARDVNLRSIHILKYGDFNSDGYMDVMIECNHNGSGCGHKQISLTRKYPGGMFFVTE